MKTTLIDLNTCVPVIGASGYLLSQTGEVISLRGKVARLLKKQSMKSSHIFYYLTTDEGNRKIFYLHRLIAIHFIPNPNPDKYKLVRHLDDIPTNNAVSNLSWGNHSLNRIDDWRNNRNRQYCFIRNGQRIVVDNIAKFASENNYDRSCIFKLLSGKVKQHKGLRLPED
jgi:hypothetical protein